MLGHGALGELALGQATSIQDLELAGAVGTFTFTGHNATLRAGRRISAEQPSYALTFYDAELGVDGQISTILEGGSFTFTGQASGLLHNRLLSADAASFALTGNDVEFGDGVVGARGAFAFTGNDAGLLYGRSLAAATGEFDFVGRDASIEPTDFAATAAEGSFSLTLHRAHFTVTRSHHGLITGRGFQYTLDDTITAGR